MAQLTWEETRAIIEEVQELFAGKEVWRATWANSV
jgi:hypothetical protein